MSILYDFFTLKSVAYASESKAQQSYQSKCTSKFCKCYRQNSAVNRFKKWRALSAIVPLISFCKK